jgi:hypothetical protein
MISLNIRRALRQPCCLIFVQFFLVLTCYGQNSSPYQRPTVIPPSPEAASLGKFGDIPVGYYTGVPSILVPIWNLKSRDIEVPISLDYHAGGIKVDEIASSVGLGWSLQAGGSISVSTMGHPDESSTFERVPFPEELVTEGPSGHPVFTEKYQTYFQAVTSGVTDSEPDVYYFNFLGKNGKFIYDHQGNALIVPHQSLQVTRNFANGTFQIVDEKGWKFTFQSGDGTEIQSRLVWRGNAAPESTYPQPPSIGVLSSYVLTTIDAPSGDQVTFSYEPYSYRYKSSYSEVDYTLIPATYCTPADLPLRETWERTTILGGLRLRGIHTPQGDNVWFNYSTSPRLDVEPSAGGSNGALVSIIVERDDKVIKEFNLQHDYFKTAGYSNVTEDKNLHRKLKLTSVTEVGKPSYKFYYYEMPSFPKRFTRSQDHWGYYNGKDNSTTSLPRVAYGNILLEGADRNPEENSMKVGTLKSLTYPTGGSTHFEFQAHDYATMNTVFQWPDPITAGIGISVSADPDAPTTASISFVIPDNAQSCSVDGVGQPGKKVRISMNRPNGTEIQTPGIAGTAMANISGPDNIHIVASGNINYEACLPAGTYNGFAAASGSFDQNSGDTPAWASVSITWYIPPASSTTITNVPIGGLRVSKIIDKDFDNRTIKVRRFDYKKPNSDESSGILANRPAIGYVTNIWKQVPPDDFIAECNIYVRETHTSVPLGSVKGCNVAYQYVTVFEGENGEGGKTTYQYTTFGDLAPVRTYPLVPDTDYDWLRGILLRKSTFKKTPTGFSEIEREENHYNLYHDPFGFWAFRNGTTNPFRIDFGDPPSPDDGSPFTIQTTPPGYNVEKNVLCLRSMEALKTNTSTAIAGEATVYAFNYYKYVSAHFELIKTKRTTFTDGGNTSLFEQRFYYDNYKHLSPTRLASNNSDGTITITVNKYAGDYDNLDINSTDLFGQGISVLNKNHQIANLIESQVWRKKGASYIPMSAMLTTYKLYNNKVRMAELFSIKNGSNVRFQQSLINDASKFIFDNTYRKEIDFKLYDTWGNLQDYTTANGEHLSFIYGYNHHLPIAKILNAESTQVFHTSFEGTGEGDSNDGDAKTGRKSRIGGFGTILSGLTPGKYFYSYWQNVGSNWQNVSQVVNVDGSFQINLSGQVDEIRFHPVTSLMETYCHEPGVGISAMTDKNNITKYYKYDSMGRLRAVLDEKHNVLETYRYNYMDGD